MHQRSMQFLVAVLAAMLFPFAATAADAHRSKDDAVQFVKKAVALIKQQGQEKAMAEFNHPAGRFVEGELYIVVLDLNGVVLADGTKPKLVGKSLLDLKDVNGKYFVREEIELAKANGKGWIDFQWVNPLTQAMEPRSSYFERVDGSIVITGIYTRR